MKHFLQKSAIIYLLFTITVSLAVLAYQRRVTNRLDRADKLACKNSRTLIAHDEIILDIVHRNVEALAFDTHLDSINREYFKAAISRIEAAQVELSLIPVCQTKL